MWNRRGPRRPAIYLPVIVMASLAMVAGCSSSGSTATTSSTGGTKPAQKTDVSLRLDFLHIAEAVPLTYGVATGIFAKHGINLTILDGHGSATTGQTVAQGQDDFGEADGGTVMTLQAKGAPLVSIMNYLPVPQMSAIVPADSSISSIKDLAGKTLGIAAGDAPSTLFPAVLAANDMSKDSVHIVSLAGQAKQTEYLQGKLDGFLGGLIIVAQMDAGGRKSKAILYADNGVVVPGIHIITSKNYLSAHEAVVKNLVHAIQESVIASLKDPTAAVASYVKKYPDMAKPAAAEFKLVETVMAPKGSSGHVVGTFDPKLLQSGSDLLEQYGLLTKGYTPKEGVTYTNQYLDSSVTFTG